MLAGLATGATKWSFAPVLIIAFGALGLLGLYWLGSGVTVTADFQRRVFQLRQDGDVSFDAACGLLITTTTRADLKTTNTWFLLYLLTRPDGEDLLHDAQAGEFKNIDDGTDGCHLLAATWRHDALEPAAEALAESLKVRLADATKAE